MRKNTKSIPVNTMADNFDTGISIGKTSFKNLNDQDSTALDNTALDNTALDNPGLNSSEEAKQSHREDRHSFFLLEKGTVYIEIDFQQYKIEASSVIYMHPDQVHRILDLENVTVTSWAVNNENLNPEYLKLLEDLRPSRPLVLNTETFAMLCETAAIAIKFAERTRGKLYHSLLKDSCNALVGLVISHYLELSKPTDKFSRFETVTKAFKEILDHSYIHVKRPAEYAQQLNVSTPYLNECVKNATGYAVSYHIQQRIILEAKRLLYYSDQSVKEIATGLGYDDYPYFSRLFTKVTGMTALAFRNKKYD